MTREQIALGEGPESLASLCLHLRRMSDGQGDQIDADRLSRCADLIEAQAAELVEIRSKQTYRYIGKDGKMILARDLEDQRDALSAELELERLRAALTKLRDLMCEGFEDDDGNSGCGKCENDCTGCIADRALKGGA